MTSERLGEELKQMCRDAKPGEQKAMAVLFGIRYADAIRECGEAKLKIIQVADLIQPYLKEIEKGMILARYVTVKDEWL